MRQLRNNLARGRWFGLAIASILIAGLVASARADTAALPSAKAFDQLFARLDLGDLSALDIPQQRKVVEQLQNLLPEGDHHRARLLDSMRCELNFVNAPKDGFKFANKHLAEALHAGDNEATIRYYYCRGGYQESISTARDALADYQHGIDLSRSSDNRPTFALGLALRGSVYSLLGIYGKSLADLLEAQQMFIKLELPEAASQNLQAIGIAYRRLGYMSKAREFLNQSITHEQAVGDQESLFASLLQLGFTDQETGHANTALATFRRALVLVTPSGDRAGMGSANLAIASVLNDLGRHQEAMNALRTAHDQFTSTGDVADLGMLNFELGRALSGLGHLDRSLDAFASAQAAFSKSGNRRYQQLLYNAKAKTLERQGHSRQALAAYRKYMQARDEVERQRADQQAQMLREQFDTDRSNLENSRLKTEQALKDRQVQTLQRVRRWQQAAMGLLAILLGILTTLAYRQLQRLRRWKRMASLDPLTGIANRRSIEEFLAAAMRHAQTRHEPLSLLAIDIDRFKRINDEYGHAAGDHTLLHITGACQSILRDGDLLGRIGGEEFLAVLPGSELSGAENIAERLRSRVEALDAADGLASKVTISIGVAQMSAADSGIEDIEHRADEALYRAKSEGRNRVASAT